MGLLGPNGAGKSTLMNLFVGLRSATSGTVELLGGSPSDPAVRRGIGVTPQETGLPEVLRVGEVVDFVSSHFPKPVAKAELLDRFGLGELVKRQIGGLSGGQKRRLAVALAFVGDPRLVFLDEPTTGLDVEARRTLWDGIRAFHEGGGTILLTSHYLEEIEALAERVVVVGHGRVLADDTVAAVRDVVGARRVSFDAGELPELPGVAGVQREGGRVHLVTPRPRPARGRAGAQRHAVLGPGDQAHLPGGGLPDHHRREGARPCLASSWPTPAIRSSSRSGCRSACWPAGCSRPSRCWRSRCRSSATTRWPRPCRWAR
ncbi:ABC transporter ATP-binding protein [Nonomuraea ferruginea]